MNTRKYVHYKINYNLNKYVYDMTVHQGTSTPMGYDRIPYCIWENRTM